MKVKDLNPNKYNPRKISAKKKDLLKNSLSEFGDLGGIIFNRDSKTLVGGHQRSSSMPPDAVIKIEKKYDVPTSSGTVAEGYIEHNGERYSYREVSWDKKKETEALLAANKISGDWDKDLLRLMITDIPELQIENTGFDILELEAMQIKIPKVIIPTIEEMTDEIYGDELDQELDDDLDAIDNEESDEDYLKNNTGPDVGISKEQIPSTTVYEDVKENVESKNNSKILVIIEMDNVEGRDKLKEVLRTESFNLKQYGAKMY